MEKMANDVVIVDGVRTPFAKAGTALKRAHAADLGQAALKELIARTNLDPETVEEVIIGSVGNPPDAVNISRVVALRSGIPMHVSAHTVHRNCASALESISSGYNMIKAGSADVVIAGGTENMSTAPIIWGDEHVARLEKLSSAKTMGKRLSALWGLLSANLNQIKELVTTPPMKATKFKPRISLVEALVDPFAGINMGQTAEILAKEFTISRGDQDQFALNSHLRALASTKNGILGEELVPFFTPPNFKHAVEKDMGPRDGQTIEALAKLRPFFDRKTGTITVGNACPITDGAAMVLLMSRKQAEAEGHKPLARIRSYAYAGLEPERMGLGPAYATPKALKKAGLSLKDMGAYELNEAFAAQVLACREAMMSKKWCEEKLGLSEAVGELDMDRLNANGGAIAIGHPVGATGSRLVLTLAKEMKRKNLQYGLATLCIGGGQGGAMILENEG